MYIFKNAFISITRNKGRNILIAVIILVVSCSCAVTLAIKNSANSLIESYKNQYDITGTLQINRSSLIQNFDSKSQSKEDMTKKFESVDNITVNDIENYANSEYIKSYYYTNTLALNAKDIEKASNTSSNSINSSIVMQPMDSVNISPNGKATNFSLTGYSKLEAMQEFINGKYKITSGQISEDFTSNNCIINSELAKLNDLKVGDTITFLNPNDETKTYEFVISGIFEEIEDTLSDNKFNLFSGSANTIITNSNAINNMTNNDADLKAIVNPTFILKSADVIENYTAELREKGLNEYLELTTNIEDVNSATDSISNISTFATTFLIITLIIGAVVLVIVNMINIRERKYEIGVLRTIGMKKGILTCQFMIELLIITMIALLIGTAIGSVISVPTANMLLENEISTANEQSEQVNQNFGGGMRGQMQQGYIKFSGVNQIEPISSINAVVDFKVLLQLIGIGILLTMISGIVSMVSVQRFSPLTILKERS